MEKSRNRIPVKKLFEKTHSKSKSSNSYIKLVKEAIEKGLTPPKMRENFSSSVASSPLIKLNNKKSRKSNIKKEKKKKEKR